MPFIPISFYHGLTNTKANSRLLYFRQNSVDTLMTFYMVCSLTEILNIGLSFHLHGFTEFKRANADLWVPLLSESIKVLKLHQMRENI